MQNHSKAIEVIGTILTGLFFESLIFNMES